MVEADLFNVSLFPDLELLLDLELGFIDAFFGHLPIILCFLIISFAFAFRLLNQCLFNLIELCLRVGGLLVGFGLANAVDLKLIDIPFKVWLFFKLFSTIGREFQVISEVIREGREVGDA